MSAAKLGKSAPRRHGTAAGGAFARTLLAAAFLLGLSVPALAESASGTAKVNPWTMCARATNNVERDEGIPRQLLRAISKIEAGRYHAGKRLIMAWPWTVMAEGRGRYLSSKAAAIAEVHALQARGVRNIDVGCMQVNLQHHPEAFDSLADAFDPLTNVTYAAGFLKSLAAEEGSWAKAVARYHSANPERYRLYRAKVHSAWRREREKYLVALQQARLELQQTATSGTASTGPTQASQTEDETPLLLAALSFAAAPLPGGPTDSAPVRRLLFAAAPPPDESTDTAPVRRLFPDRADAAPHRPGFAAAPKAADDVAATALAFGRAGPIEADGFLEAAR
jgi:hypothetical protein